jgi:hypothetical protein
MNLVCNLRSFPVETNILIDKLSLFIDQADLLRKTSFETKSRIPTEAFPVFIQASSGIEIDTTEAYSRFLLSLSREFGFDRLLRNCVAFLHRNPPDDHRVSLLTIPNKELPQTFVFVCHY